MPEQSQATGAGLPEPRARHGFLPAGGWGCGWPGDPDRGFDERQPGGWLFNILPYIEQQALHDLQRQVAARPTATTPFRLDAVHGDGRDEFVPPDGPPTPAGATGRREDRYAANGGELFHAFDEANGELMTGLADYNAGAVNAGQGGW